MALRCLICLLGFLSHFAVRNVVELLQISVIKSVKWLNWVAIRVAKRLPNRLSGNFAQISLHLITASPLWGNWASLLVFRSLMSTELASLNWASVFRPHDISWFLQLSLVFHNVYRRETEWVLKRGAWFLDWGFPWVRHCSVRWVLKH